MPVGSRSGRPSEGGPAVGCDSTTKPRELLAGGQPAEGKSRERDRLVRVLLAALVETAEPAVGQHGQARVCGRAGVQHTMKGPGLPVIFAGSHGELLALRAGGIGEQDVALAVA